jgi:uncharacterized protein YcaQ
VVKSCLGSIGVFSILELTRQQARKVALARRGLHKTNAFGQGIKGAHNVINQLSYIQIDSISVIQRVHHHCIWS